MEAPEKCRIYEDRLREKKDHYLLLDWVQCHDIFYQANGGVSDKLRMLVWNDSEISHGNAESRYFAVFVHWQLTSLKVTFRFVSSGWPPIKWVNICPFWYSLWRDGIHTKSSARKQTEWILQQILVGKQMMFWLLRLGVLVYYWMIVWNMMTQNTLLFQDHTSMWFRLTKRSCC